MLDGISIGSFTIHFYGIIIMVGVLAATFLAQHEANRRVEDGSLVWDLLIIVAVVSAILLIARRIHYSPSPSHSTISDEEGHSERMA